MPADTNGSASLFRVAVTCAVVVVTVSVVLVWTLLSTGRSPRQAPPAATGATSIGPANRPPPVTPSALPATAAPLPPRWIWSSVEPRPGEMAWFRRTLPLDTRPRRARLRFTADDEARVFVGDRLVAESDGWETPQEVDLAPRLDAGPSVLTVQARNRGGPAGFIAVLDLEMPDGRPDRLVTDRSWLAATTADFTDARAAVELGVHGVAPWGELMGLLSGGVDRAVTVPEGYAVERVYEVPRAQGSWISLTVDPHGRLIASAEGGGLHRLSVSPPGLAPPVVEVETIDVPLGGAQGLLCVEDDLYCVVSVDPPPDETPTPDDASAATTPTTPPPTAPPTATGPGLYRLRDTDGDGRYDTWTRLRALGSGGEHGPHGIALGPDGFLYIAAGNHTPLPAPERSLVPRRWDEDLLLPRLWDPTGHAVGITAPGGWICRTDRDGRTWELVASGFRNPYDLAFDRHGELFTFDADMEWDLGAPWYRPTRVNHVVSGAEFGWRSGSGKWPPHYADSLPAILDVGPGSPTGVLFGTGAAFPVRDQRALFLLDWTYGTIYAVDLEPAGATYRATRRTFLTGRPLPLTDAVVNPADGALYFAVGGRGAASAVYRVWHEPGAIVDASSDTHDDAILPPARALRHELETLHHPSAPASAVDTAWPHLASDDRFVRYAARVALEHQPVERWRERALDASPTPAPLGALIAAARCATPAEHARLVETLAAYRWAELDRVSRLDWLRAWGLCFVRTGRPEAATARALAARLEAVYPGGDDVVDRELCDLLVSLDSRIVVARTVPLLEHDETPAGPAPDRALLARRETYGRVLIEMADAPPPRQQVHYALALREAEHGWTPELRARYFAWFESALATKGGVSFAGFLEQIRRDALARVPPHERPGLPGVTEVAVAAEAGPVPVPRGPGRTWTVSAVLKLVGPGVAARDHANGRRMFRAALCDRCHRFAGAGRAGGPDLTTVATRYAMPELVESLVEPSKTISDQYAQTDFVLDDGRVVTGRVVAREPGHVRLISSLLVPDATVDVPTARIRTERHSSVSAMMPGLIDALGPDEVLDLLAYLWAEGDPEHAVFESAP